jgi:DNA-binding GntR family transcriptional regulator
MAFGDRSGRIEHSGPLTVWRQLADDIAADITSGRLEPGWKLPPETELAESYGVARNTVRRAVAGLVEEGRLVVVHGRGTFVAIGQA